MMSILNALSRLTVAPVDAVSIGASLPLKLPVKLKLLQHMAGLEQLSDADMVHMQRAAMTNPYAPNPSVEAVLHAIIPFKFVDHSHADAVVTITNSVDGEEKWKISMKLLERYEGPYTIIRKINPVLYDADVAGVETRVHATNMKPF